MVEREYAALVAFCGRPYSPVPDTLNAVRAAAGWLTAESPRPWLVLSGQVGTGKSVTVRAVASVLHILKDRARTEAGKARRRLEREGGRPTEAELEWDRMDRLMPVPLPVTASLAADLMRRGAGSFETLKTEPLLSIDDLGTEPAVLNDYGTRLTPLADILCARYDSRLATIITTNLNRAGIAAAYGERVADRFDEMAEWVVYGNRSFRRTMSYFYKPIKDKEL